MSLLTSLSPVVCFSVVCDCDICWWFSNHLTEEDGADCFTSIVRWLSVFRVAVPCVGLWFVIVAFPGHTH